jgi:hypothetical protein
MDCRMSAAARTLAEKSRMNKKNKHPDCFEVRAAFCLVLCGVMEFQID